MNCFLLFACCNLDDVPIRMFSTFAEAENAAMSMPPEPPEINPLIAWDTSGIHQWFGRYFSSLTAFRLPSRSSSRRRTLLRAACLCRGRYWLAAETAETPHVPLVERLLLGEQHPPWSLGFFTTKGVTGMITCDLCQCKNGPGNYCNDVVASNISTVASHSNPKPNEKSSSRTLHIFRRGQLCEKCFSGLG